MSKPVILSAARTPMGSFLGGLKDLSAPQLGAVAIKKALEKASAPGGEVDECLMGNVISAGMGQAPARQAALGADMPNSVRCTTLNRVCGSGLKSVMWAHQMIQCQDAEMVVAGGMENMSQAPYLVPKAREGYRLGNGQLLDSMIQDGLWDPYNDKHMGVFGELCASEHKISREEQDRFAVQSYQRAQAATESGHFKEELAPVEIQQRKGTVLIERDEDPFRVDFDKVSSLRSAFQKDGTITAGNASTLSDGAAALVIASEEKAKSLGAKPIARILCQESFAHQPEWFTTAPVGAVQKLLKKAKMEISDIDLFEINEAFAVVALTCIKELGLSEEKVNIHGGAIAMGHPLGASGARILTTLIHGLRLKKKSLGVATLCIGGGEASAVLVEVLN